MPNIVPKPLHAWPFLIGVHFQAEMPDWAGITRAQVNSKKWQKIKYGGVLLYPMKNTAISEDEI
jgi:hypothetical protein